MMHQVSITSKNRGQEQKQQRILLGLVVECGVPDQQAMISETLRILKTLCQLQITGAVLEDEMNLVRGLCAFCTSRKMKEMTPPMTWYIPSLPHTCHVMLEHASLNPQHYSPVREPIYLAWILAQDDLKFVATRRVYCVLSHMNST